MKLNIQKVSSDKLNIIKLSKGRIDLVLIDKGVGQYIINTQLSKEDANNLEWVEHTIKTNIQYIGFSKKTKDYKNKLIDFNRGLVQLVENGMVKKIMKKHGLAN